MGEINVLIVVSGVENICVVNSIGLKIDWCGYIVVFYVIFYWENWIVFDVVLLKCNVDFENVVVNVVFIKGVLVLVEFNVYVGVRVLMKILK